MPSFDEVKHLFALESTALIESTLRTWAGVDLLGAVLYRNILEMEHFLDEEAWPKLLKPIVDLREESRGAVLREYEKACWRTARHGGQAKGDMPLVLGRIVLRASFVNYLMTADSQLFKKRESAEEFVDRLLDGESPNAFEKELSLSMYSFWATWSTTPNVTSPFGFSKSEDPDEIRANLGLWPQERTVDAWILLEYPCVPGMVLHRPTISDAALSVGFCPPAKDFDRHGWTQPWPAGACEPDWDIAPRPEVVHVAPTFADLNLPIKELPR